LTVRKALDGLEREGLVVRRRGAGTFVSRHATAPSASSVFQEDIICAGADLSEGDVTHVMGAVTADEAMIFGVAIGTRVVRLNRMRCQDDAPVAVEKSVVLASCLGDGAVVKGSLYRTMQQFGKCPSRVLRRVRAVALTAEEAAHLDVPIGSPGLYMERRGFLRDGRTVELTQAWYRADRADLVSEANIPATRD
jgi:GntR family transcriptional regulator